MPERDINADIRLGGERLNITENQTDIAQDNDYKTQYNMLLALIYLSIYGHFMWSILLSRYCDPWQLFHTLTKLWVPWRKGNKH